MFETRANQTVNIYMYTEQTRREKESVMNFQLKHMLKILSEKLKIIFTDVYFEL